MLIKVVKNAFLRWSDLLAQRSGIDINYYIKGGFLTTFGYAMDVASGIIVGFAFARLIPREVYGQWQLIQSFWGIASIFALSGMGPAVIRAVAQGNDGMYKRGIATVFKWSFLGSLGIAVASGYYYYYLHEVSYASTLLALSALFPFSSICGYYGNLLFGQKKLKKLAIFNAYSRLFYTITVIPLIYFQRELFPIAFGSVLIDTTVRGILTFKSLGFIRNDNIDKGTVTYGKQISYLKILQIVADQIDGILIASYLGFESLAVYSIARAIPDIIRDLSGRLVNLSIPKISQWEEDIHNKRFVKLYTIRLIWFSILIILIYVIICPLLFRILFPKYLDAIQLSQIYILTFIGFPATLLGIWFQATKKIRIISFNYTYSAATQIILNIFLIPILGSLGAIIAKVTNYVTSFIISYLLFIRATNAIQDSQRIHVEKN